MALLFFFGFFERLTHERDVLKSLPSASLSTPTGSRPSMLLMSRVCSSCPLSRTLDVHLYPLRVHACTVGHRKGISRRQKAPVCCAR